MTAVLQHADKRRLPPKARALDGERRCLASGIMKPRAELIRFVIAPDRSVAPDLSENLPGRGLWVTASREAIETAARKNLFAKAAKSPAKPSPDLADLVAELLRKRCLRYLGLAKSAGIALLGEAQTEAALRADKCALYLHAPDAGRALDNRAGVAECVLFSRDELGAALGYAHIVYAAISRHGLTEKLQADINRLTNLETIQET